MTARNRAAGAKLPVVRAIAFARLLTTRQDLFSNVADKSSESYALRKSIALQKTLVRLTAQIHPIVEGGRRKQFHAVTSHAARRTATVLRRGSDH
jgi:hypothetical protein